jgi:hypothetical protein
VLRSKTEAQAALDAWVADYNTNRPHQAIGMLTPNQRFDLRAPSTLPVEEPAPANTTTVTRKVARNGVVSVSHQVFSVGAALAHKTVTVEIEDELLHVWCDGTRVRTVLRTSRGEVRKKRARAS